MRLRANIFGVLIFGLGLLLLAGCSKSGDTAGQAGVEITAPSGTYEIDPNHARVAFSVKHLGLSNYVARFTEYDVTVNLNPDQLSKSSVQATIYPASVVTDYAGDYKATHEDSPFDTWDQALAQDERFFNAGQYPTIEFRSTKVKKTGTGRMQITGDLTMRGQTHPVTLDARVVGSVAEHPFSGVGAIGLSATGTFKRTAFGMDYLTDPPLVGDEVTLLFEGEFNQVVEQAKAE